MRPPHNDWIQGNSAGAYTSTVDKFLIHTTEGSSIDGAVGAYRANNSWPHLTVDCMYGHSYRICGHLDLDVAARSLRNESGGVQTNTDGVVQVEVCGFAENPGGIDWGWLGANVVGPCCEMKNIQVVSTLPWVAYPASYGTGAVQRLSSSQWTDYRGILGHQHAPENSHGDPGAIPIKTLLDAASEDNMPLNETDKTIIRNILRQELYGDDTAHNKGLKPIIRNEVKAVVEEMMTTSGSVVRQEGRLLAKLGTEDAINDQPTEPEVPAR